MNNFLKKLRKNIAFLIITVLVFLAAFICTFAEYIGENPFAAEVGLNNPVQAVFSESGNVYVTDSSVTILYADSENRLKYIINGGDPDNSFDEVDSVAVDHGDIYVIDSSFNDDGTYAYSQRVLKFSDNGKKREILYTVDTLDEDGVQVIYLDSPTVMDGEIYFSEITSDGIYVKGADGKVYGFMPLENACDFVGDSTFNESFEITAACMNGDVYTYADGKMTQLYNAREQDTEEYCSLITEIAYGNGSLYLNDMGLRQIYRLTDAGMEVCIGRNAFSGESAGDFAENAIYSGLHFSEGNISVVSSSYQYDEDGDSYEYTYNTAAITESGMLVFYDDVIGISAGYHAVVWAVYSAIFLTLLIAVYSVYKIGMIVRAARLENSYTQLIVLVIALVITIGVSYTIFDSCNERYMLVSAENLANIAYLTDASIDKEILAEINSPDDYYSVDYAELSDEVTTILKSSVNGESNIYTVIYKVFNNVICEVYRNDFAHAVMYPMAGTFEGSIEQSMVRSGECYISTDYQLSEGSYTFALIPSYDEDGTFIGLIEVGTDYNYLMSENRTLYKRILIISAMAVIIIMLLFGEIMNAVAAVKGRRRAAAEKQPYPPEVIRPITFMIFFTANITTAFLPIYGMSLWNEQFPAAAEVAAAFPLSAECILAAVSALLGGMFIKQMPVKAMCAAGGLCYIGGNILSAFAPNLWVLIAANSMCGIGGGIFAISLNAFIAGYDDESMQNKGFIHYNAAILAGMNCGTVVGSLICDNAGVFSAYMTAAAGAVATIILSMFLLENRKVAVAKTETGKEPVRLFFTWNIVKYFVCMVIPYLICGAFLNYYFPVVAENHALSASEISMAFLISGVISIYTGTVIGETVINYLGAGKAMLLASFLYAAALFYLFVNPSIISCYIVIILFAAADSFGFSAQSSYFISQPEVMRLGQGRALGIHSTVESAASACGSVVFGAALLLGEKRGILLIAVVFTVLMLLFAIGGRKNANADNATDNRNTAAEKNMV